MSVIAAGTQIPAFALQREDGESFGREDLLGKRTVLVFYPYAFSEVCTDQLSLYDTLLDEFTQRGATLYGVSCDARYSQAAFREQLGLSIELLSDFEPKGEVARAFGVYEPAAGRAERALVLVDPDGTVRWSHQAQHAGVLPGANLIFDALGG